MCVRLRSSEDPSFVATMGMEEPWDEEPLFTQMLMHDPAKKEDFHKIDLFHTISLGIGKPFAASAICILQELLAGGSIEQRLKDFTSMYLEYCRDFGLQCCWICIFVDFMCWFLFRCFASILYIFSGYGPASRKTRKRAMSKRLTGPCLGGSAHQSLLGVGPKVLSQHRCASSCNTSVGSTIWRMMMMKSCDW